MKSLLTQKKYTNLLLEIIDNIALVTLNNPPAHTWTADSLCALTQLVDDLNQEKSIYSLVITGNGDRFFSAGADLKLFANSDKSIALEMAYNFGTAFEALSNFRGVSIAAINGYAMGGGLECALACDIRIAEHQAVMALPEATVGLIPCAGGTQNLPWLVGEGWAKRMILCGEHVNAETALKIGLIEEITEKGMAKEKALELAALVKKQSPSSIETCKILIQGARSNPLATFLPLERELFMTTFDSKNQKEGVNAFLDKRNPQWSHE